MSNDWKDYIPSPIEVFHGEAIEQFHRGSRFKANETFVEGIRYMSGIAVNEILADFKVKIMNQYGISPLPTLKTKEENAQDVSVPAKVDAHTKINDTTAFTTITYGIYTVGENRFRLEPGKAYDVINGTPVEAPIQDADKETK